MKVYLKDNKLILDASGRVFLKIIVYSAMIILCVFGLSELLHNAKENVFEIILYSVLLVVGGLYLFLSNSLLSKVTFDENGIRETRMSFIKNKFISWDNLEDYCFMEFKKYRSEYPKFSKAIFTSKDLSDKKAYQIQTPYYAGKKKEEYERSIRDYCDKYIANHN